MPASSTPARRGAPAGNRNALKHGFYSRQFTKADLPGLDQAGLVGLQDEITLMRVYIRRIFQN